MGNGNAATDGKIKDEIVHEFNTIGMLLVK